MYGVKHCRVLLFHSIFQLSVKYYTLFTIQILYLYVFFLQMTLIGLLSVKKGYYQAVALFILLIFVINIHSVLQKKVQRLFDCVCLETAFKADAETKFAHTHILQSGSNSTLSNSNKKNNNENREEYHGQSEERDFQSSIVLSLKENDGTFEQCYTYPLPMINKVH